MTPPTTASRDRAREVCDQCGLPLVECSALASARNEAESWLRDIAEYPAVEAREAALRLVPHRGADGAEQPGMPTIWEDPAAKGYPCFERPMTPAECCAMIDRLLARIEELEAPASSKPVSGDDEIAALTEEIAALRGDLDVALDEDRIAAAIQAAAREYGDGQDFAEHFVRHLATAVTAALSMPDEGREG